MTIRKNFLLDEEIASHLEAIAKKENTTQSKVIRDMIEEKYKQISVDEKLEAFRSIKPFSGLFKDKTIQSIKEEMGSNI